MERLGQGPTLHGGGKATPRRGAEFVPGDRLGRYVIEAKLGSGAMGVVLLARDPELDRPVAVKLIHQDMGGLRAQTRFVREAQAMAAIDHPNVITVFDVGTHDGRVFIAMELVEGATLEDWLQPGRSWQEVLEIFRAAGRGLAAAHDVDLIHRDFKLANVMVATDGRVKVMDFGLVRPAGLRLQRPLLPTVIEMRDDAAIDLTRTGRVLGTPAYMAPEQHAGSDLDPRSDQFSFGAALYEALYGQRAFRGETSGELAAATRNAEIAPPPSHTDVPAWVRDIVFRTLRPNPDERFGSMHEVIEALAGNHRSGMPMRRLAAYGAMGVVVAGGITFLATDRPTACAGGGSELSTMHGTIDAPNSCERHSGGPGFRMRGQRLTGRWGDSTNIGAGGSRCTIGSAAKRLGTRERGRHSICACVACEMRRRAAGRGCGVARRATPRLG